MQLKLINGELEKITERERLMVLRQKYYDELVNEIFMLKNCIKDKIMVYKKNVNDIDSRLKMLDKNGDKNRV